MDFNLLTGDGRIIYSTEGSEPLENISDGLLSKLNEKATMDYFIFEGNGSVEGTELYSYAVSEMKKLSEIRFIGEAEVRSGVISFEIDGIHPHDVGTILDQEGVAIRTGHHCAQPVMEFFNVPATARASFACYNTKEEVDIFINAIKKLYEVFK